MVASWQNLAQSKERKRSKAIVLQARRAKQIQSKNLALAIWQPCLGDALREGPLLLKVGGHHDDGGQVDEAESHTLNTS